MMKNVSRRSSLDCYRRSRKVSYVRRKKVILEGMLRPENSKVLDILFRVPLSLDF